MGGPTRAKARAAPSVGVACGNKQPLPRAFHDIHDHLEQGCSPRETPSRPSLPESGLQMPGRKEHRLGLSVASGLQTGQPGRRALACFDQPTISIAPFSMASQSALPLGSSAPEPYLVTAMKNVKYLMYVPLAQARCRS